MHGIDATKKIRAHLIMNQRHSIGVGTDSLAAPRWNIRHLERTVRIWMRGEVSVKRPAQSSPVQQL
jgi:hypothetical protein